MNKGDYIKYYFIKRFSSSIGTTNMLFAVHKGFESLDELKDLLAEKKIDYNCVVVVKFLNMYYGIIFEDYNRNYIIGKLKTYYVNDEFIMIGCNTKSFKMKFNPTKIKKQIYTHQTLAADLFAQDPNMDVLLNDESIFGYKYANTYAIILALSFVDYYFTYDEMYILNNYYFSQDYSSKFKSGVIGINPFRGYIMLRGDGPSNYKIRKHQFYEGFTPFYMRNSYNVTAPIPRDLSIGISGLEEHVTIDEISTIDDYVSADSDVTKVISLEDYRKKKNLK